MNKVPLLRVPQIFRTVSDVLSIAGKLDLPNCLLLSELEDGRLVFLETEMSLASANWLLDRMKVLLITPSVFERTQHD